MRNIFGNRYKSKIMKANRHIPIGEVSIMAGKAFREITQEEEAKLSEQAHALLITMTKNAIKFGRDLQHGRAKAKEKNAKKQHSVFPFFFKQQRQNIIDENPGLTNTQIMKKAGEMYRNLGEEEKDQVRWEAEQLRNNVLGEKVPPPLSSFMLFKEEKMAAYTEKFPYKSKQDIMQLIGWEWRITPNIFYIVQVPILHWPHIYQQQDSDYVPNHPLDYMRTLDP
ncbi:hypothetical protein BDA99DRAFT_519051 [Phascolomyces articulosus]|uniref:HMG box domain-containing protein n=1 Tax=Phascolomyces articulosus TaxID=60185 RepID=A0AAD5PAR4_9FUNG|nr:hypothetical protein BDA99DRAFT_519051 [Phascolomyces articulosus]